MPPSEVGYAYGVFQYRSNCQESGPPTGSHPQCRGKGEVNYLHIVRSNNAKPKQLIFNKTYLTKVVINS
jgi:hypothetical protein